MTEANAAVEAVETETIVPETIEKPAEAVVVEKAADTPADAPKPTSEADKPEGEADKADPDDKAKTDEFSWPDDWRERIAGEDEDVAKLLKRYGSPAGVAKALKAAQDTIRSGKLQKPMPDGKDEKAMAEWRKEQGIPDDPSGYKLPDTVTSRLVDEDKPVLANYTEFMHKRGASQAEIERNTEWYVELKEQAAELQMQSDKSAAEEAEDALRKDWSHGEFKANMTLAKRYIESIPGVGANWSEFRGPDGRRLGDNPEFIAGMADNGREKFGDVTFATGDSERKHTARREELEKIRDTNFDEYEEKGYDRELRGLIEKDLARGKR